MESQKTVGSVDGAKLPKAKTTALGLYVTAAEAYAKWQADPEGVKILDVRTPEEHFFVGHPPMAWNPVDRDHVRWDAEKEAVPTRPLSRLRRARQEGGAARRHLLVTCRSGGRSAMGEPARAGRLHAGLQHRRRHGRRRGGRSRAASSSASGW